MTVFVPYFLHLNRPALSLFAHTSGLDCSNLNYQNVYICQQPPLLLSSPPIPYPPSPPPQPPPPQPPPPLPRREIAQLLLLRNPPVQQPHLQREPQPMVHPPGSARPAHPGAEGPGGVQTRGQRRTRRIRGPVPLLRPQSGLRLHFLLLLLRSHEGKDRG